MPPTLETPLREQSEMPRRDDDCLVHSRRAMSWGEHPVRRRSSILWLQINSPYVLPSQGQPARHQPLDYRGSPAGLFEELADRWETETAFESVVSRKAMHPAYQRIIGMGDQAVPLILKRLQRMPRQWFWALTAITGEDPALGETTLDGASAAWLTWGRERGLVGE